MSDSEHEGSAGMFTHLRDAVQALAGPAHARHGVSEPALSFGHWCQVVLDNHQDYLSAAQLTALDHLAGQLEAMTDWGGPALGTPDALRGSAEGTTVRALAGEVLDAFGWPRAAPPGAARDG